MTDLRQRLRRASEQLTPPDRAFDRLLERRDRKRRRERVVAATVALVLALGVIGGGLSLLSGLLRERARPGGGGTEQVDTRLVLGTDEYFYLRIHSSEAVDGHIRDEETWWALDGSGEVRNRSTRQDKYAGLPTGVYDAGKFPVELFAGKDVSELSTDPETLSAQLRTAGYADHSEPERTMDVVNILLLDYPNVTPELRAALFEVAAGMEGVRRTEHVEDPGGRSATALSFVSREVQGTWTEYFDPTTRQLMAWTWAYEDNRPAWVVLESAIVDSPGVRPTAEEWLFPQLTLPVDSAFRS